MYHITPSTIQCTGSPIDVMIIVKPVPSIFANPTSQNICSGDTTHINLSSNIGITQFSWTVSTIGMIVGAVANTDSIIAQTLVNNGTSMGTAAYLITPTAFNCSGTPLTIPIQINPIPNISVNPLSQTICSNNAALLNFTSNISNTIFNWTVSPDNIPGATGGTGNSVNQMITITSDTSVSIIYNIVPSAGNCTGNSLNATVLVKPVPIVTLNPLSQSICSGDTANISFTNAISNTTYSWTVSTSPFVNGASGGNGTIISQILENSGSIAGNATYTVIPTSVGCVGASSTANVIINPLPVANAGSDFSMYFGTADTLNGSASSPGVNYLWSPSNLIASNQQNQINPLTVSLQASTTFVLTVTNSQTGCFNTDEVIVTVNGLPLDITSLTPTPNQTICFGDSVHLDVHATGGSGTYTFSWTSVPAGFTSTQQSITVTPNSIGSHTYIVVVNDGFNSTSSSDTVIVYPLPTVNLPVQSPVCQGSTSVPLIGGSPSGGIYSALSGVSNGLFNPAIAGPGTHIITYTYTNINGCKDFATASIVVNPSPSVTLADFASVCYGSSTFTLTGGLPTGTGGSYNGPGVSGNNFNPTIAGIGSHTITYTFTNAQNCTKTASKMIVVNPLPTANIITITDVSCFGLTNGSATVSGGSTGTLPYSYVWDNPQASLTATATGLDADVLYHVTLTDAKGCKDTAFITISEPNALSSSSSATTIKCHGENGTVTVSATGGTPPYAGAGSFIVTSGLHNYSVTDSKNCVSNTSINIPEPEILTVFSNTTTIPCFGDSSTVTISTNGGTSPYTGVGIFSVTPGVHIYPITDAHGCYTSDTIYVIEPNKLSLSLNVNNVKCKGNMDGKITASANGGTTPYSYLWSTGTTNISQIGGAGKYCITVTDAHNCIISMCDTVKEPEFLLSVSSTQTNITCWDGKDGIISVTANGGIQPYTYIWNTNPIRTTASISGLIADTTYQVTVTDSYNCHKTLTKKLSQPTKIKLDTVIVTPVTCVEGDDGKMSVAASGGIPPYKYKWYTLLEPNTTFVTGLKPGSYDVRVTDDVFCFHIFSIPISGNPLPCLEIPTVFSPNEDGIHDKWEIKNLHLYPDARIEVYNRWGNLIHSSGTRDKRWDGKYNGVPVSSGVYVYIIDIHDGSDPRQGTITIVR